MRISDWSSDVCSSDLPLPVPGRIKWILPAHRIPGSRRSSTDCRWSRRPATGSGSNGSRQRSEERRVGKEVSVRVDLGGRRIIKKKNTVYITTNPHLILNHTTMLLFIILSIIIL